jgi:hypothetical protein
MKRTILSILLIIAASATLAISKTANKLTPQEIADANDYIQSLPVDAHKPVKDIWRIGKKIKWTKESLEKHALFHGRVKKGDITRKKRVDGKLVDVICTIEYVERLMSRGNHFDPNDIQDIGNRKKSPLDGSWRHGSNPNE